MGHSVHSLILHWWGLKRRGRSHRSRADQETIESDIMEMTEQALLHRFNQEQQDGHFSAKDFLGNPAPERETAATAASFAAA
jgi:hypothetical protein